jgi:hypothetical protein
LRLVDVPAGDKGDPRAQVYIVDHLAPGSVIHRRIELSNTSSSPAHIVLYPSAAKIHKGEFQGAEGHTPNDLSTWTSVDPDAVDLPAGGRMMATVTIAIPSDAAPGEQYGVVWAETRSVSDSGGGVVQVSRVGIRLYISVGPGGAPAANFTIDSLTASRSRDGLPVVLASVHNTGGRALDLSGTLRLSNGPGGLSAGPYPANLGVTLAPGDTAPITIALDKRLPAGPWDAQITVRSGLLERSARATITFPASGTSPAAKTKPSNAGSFNQVGAGAVTLAVMGIAASLQVRRRRRRRSIPALKPRHPVGV